MHPGSTASRSPAALVALAAALAACGLLPACARSPGWVRGQPIERWPESLYLAAVGTGPDAAQAAAQARAAIGRRFEGVDGGPDRASPRTTPRSRPALVARVRQSARPPIDWILAAVHVAEQWQDGETGTVYALGVLERGPVASRLRDRMAEKGHLARQLSDRSYSAPTQLERVRLLVGALHASLERDVLYRRYGVVTGARTGSGAANTSLRIEEELLEALAEMRLALEIGGATPPEVRRPLREALARALTGLGLRLRAPGSALPSPRLTASLTLRRQPDSVAGRVVVRWDGAFELVGPPPARAVVVAARHTGQVDREDARTAHTDARVEGQRVLARDLEERLIAYLRWQGGEGERR